MHRFFILFLISSWSLLAQDFPDFLDLPEVPEVPEDPEVTEDEPFALNFLEIIPQPPKELEITNDGSVEYKRLEEELIYTGDVEILTDTGIRLYAQKATIDLKNEVVHLRDKVSVYNGPFLYRGDKSSYYYTTKRLVTGRLKAGFDPFLFTASEVKNVERKKGDSVVLKDVQITTDDDEDPGFFINADKAVLTTDELIHLRNLTVKVRGVPVFWLPFVTQSFNRELGYHFTPGGQTHLGAFLRNRYGFLLGGERDPETYRVKNPDYLVQSFFDLYTRRGLGLGLDFQNYDTRQNENFGYFGVYGIYDLDPSIQRVGSANDRDVDNTRFRLYNANRFEVANNEESKWFVESKNMLLSDPFFLEDFFEDIFRVNPNPDNFLNVKRVTQESELALTFRYQLNDFYTVDQRFPQIEYNTVARNILGSGLLFESQNSLVAHNERLGNQEREDFQSELQSLAPSLRRDFLAEALDEDVRLRLHTWNQLSYPIHNFNPFQLVPRVGVGLTYYDEDLSGEESILRSIFSANLDASFKVSKEYPDLKLPKLGLDGIKHFVQPYSQLSLIRVFNEGEVRAIDRSTPNTNPSQLNLSRFPAIDEIDDLSVVRVGVRNRLLTNREGVPLDWLSLDIFTDFSLEQNENSFSNVFTDFRWSPSRWVNFNLQGQFPISDDPDGFQELYAGFSYMPTDSFECRLGYGLIDGHPIIQDSEQLNYSLFYRFNDQWGFGLEHRWQFDDGILEDQVYSLHRSFKSWIVSAEVFNRDFRIDQEFGVRIGFTLKSFPQFSLPVGVQR